MWLNKYLVLLIILFCLFSSCEKQKQKPFSFIQLCDTQLGMGGYNHDIASFKQAVKQINELDIDFIVICGDLVNTASDSSYNDFKNIMKGLKMPCHVAPGNHDVENTPTNSTLNYYRDVIGKDYYDFEHKKNSFVVINTQLLKINVANETDKQDIWLKETLDSKKLKNQPVIVIGHFPLFTVNPEEEEHYFNLPIQKRNALLNLFETNNITAYLSGHTHKLTVNTYKDIQLVSGETTSKNLDNRPLGFRQWNVSLDTITHNFIPLKSFNFE